MTGMEFIIVPHQSRPDKIDLKVKLSEGMFTGISWMSREDVANLSSTLVTWLDITK
jgi:hypothetical protein